MSWKSRFKFKILGLLEFYAGMWWRGHLSPAITLSHLIQTPGTPENRCFWPSLGPSGLHGPPSRIDTCWGPALGLAHELGMFGQGMRGLEDVDHGLEGEGVGSRWAPLLDPVGTSSHEEGHG